MSKHASPPPQGNTLSHCAAPIPLGKTSRRQCLKTGGAMAVCGALGFLRADASVAPQTEKARIAITLDLEMARNFPNWEDTHWDYQKGNLDSAAKEYSVRAGDLVREHGGRIHYFCVGSVLEQADVSWLARLASDGHPIGNHTYDHVYLLASQPSQIQFRFERSPWLIAGQEISDVIRQNIRLTTIALRDRLGVENRGFRTPGGFANGLNDRPDLQEMLLELGFTWVSSKYPAHRNTNPMTEPSEEVYESIVAAQREAQPYTYPTGLIEVPMSPISDIGAFRNGRWQLDWFLEAVRRAVEWTIENRAVFDFLAHPSCLGVVDPQLKTLKLICEMVDNSSGKAELVDLDQIAERTI